jgi:outer membrane immunogenic protein
MFSWTGFYVGVHAGYGWGRGTASTGVFSSSGDMDGGFGGAQIGANWQTGALVLGIEADAAFADIGNSQPVLGLTGRGEIDALGTVRGRVGMAWDRALLYGTGGLAWANTDLSLNPGGFSETQTHIGWTAGVGLEYALSQNWSAKVEYLYMDFGSENYLPAVVAGGVAFDSHVHTVKFGINYRFGGMGPVMASY